MRTPDKQDETLEQKVIALETKPEPSINVKERVLSEVDHINEKSKLERRAAKDLAKAERRAAKHLAESERRFSKAVNVANEKYQKEVTIGVYREMDLRTKQGVADRQFDLANNVLAANKQESRQQELAKNVLDVADKLQKASSEQTATLQKTTDGLATKLADQQKSDANAVNEKFGSLTTQIGNINNLLAGGAGRSAGATSLGNILQQLIQTVVTLIGIYMIIHAK